MPAPTLAVNWKSGSITNEALATLGTFAVTPTVTGGIQIEAHQDGIDLEIEIGPDGRIESVLLMPARKAQAAPLLNLSHLTGPDDKPLYRLVQHENGTATVERRA